MYITLYSLNLKRITNAILVVVLKMLCMFVLYQVHIPRTLTYTSTQYELFWLSPHSRVVRDSIDIVVVLPMSTSGMILLARVRSRAERIDGYYLSPPPLNFASRDIACTEWTRLQQYTLIERPSHNIFYPKRPKICSAYACIIIALQVDNGDGGGNMNFLIIYQPIDVQYACIKNIPLGKLEPATCSFNHSFSCLSSIMTRVEFIFSQSTFTL